MAKLSINVYPRGHNYSVAIKQLHTSGRRILQLFLEQNVIKLGNYSILLYPHDRVKIEMINSNIDLQKIKNILENEENSCSIVCWKFTDSDEDEIIRDKCKATEFRENILNKYNLTPSIENWTEEINNIISSWNQDKLLLSKKDNKYFEDYFIHFVLNPLGRSVEEIIRKKVSK